MVFLRCHGGLLNLSLTIFNPSLLQWTSAVPPIVLPLEYAEAQAVLNGLGSGSRRLRVFAAAGIVKRL